MHNSFFKRLSDRVIDASVSDNWRDAVNEWEIVDCEEDFEQSKSCICGKERLYYLFTIHNVYNDLSLFPIGSSCIKRFGRADLDEEASIQERLFRLLHATSDGERILLSAEYFSRKILKFLLDEGAFDANQYNGYDPEKDYEFLIKMFNKRDKSSITSQQQRKINAIIVCSIRPYLVNRLAGKTNIVDDN